MNTSHLSGKRVSALAAALLCTVVGGAFVAQGQVPATGSASATVHPTFMGSIHGNGDDGNGGVEFYASGNDDSFSEYGVATFEITRAAFGIPNNRAIDTVESVSLTITQNDRSFTDGDRVEFFFVGQTFELSYDGLTYNSALINGLDPSQFLEAPVSLGQFEFVPNPSGGNQDTYRFEVGNVSAALVEKLNTGGQFSVIMAVTDPTHDVTYSGLNNGFDPGDPELAVDATFIEAEDVDAPMIVALTPADDTSAFAVDGVLRMTFGEVVEAGSGSIQIRAVAGGVLVEDIDVTSSSVTFDGPEVSIVPSTPLPAAEDLYVSVDEGAIVDAAGNAFAGIVDAATWNFRSEVSDEAPVVVATAVEAIPDNARAGHVVADIDVDNDGQIDGDVRYELVKAGPADSMMVWSEWLGGQTDLYRWFHRWRLHAAGRARRIGSLRVGWGHGAGFVQPRDPELPRQRV